MLAPLQMLPSQLNKVLNQKYKTIMLRAHFFTMVVFLSSSLLAYDPLQTEREQNEVPKQLKDVGIDEKLGHLLKTTDIKLIDDDGSIKKISDLLSPHRPVILSLVYFNCPSLCSLHLNGVLDSLQQLTLIPGTDYELLAVSFDSKENSDLAAAKKMNYLEKYQFLKKGEGIHFLTGDENSLKTLADAIGFKYKWDETSKEWAHASAAVIITPDGTISRYLHGVYFEPKTFRLSIVEASKGLVGSIVDSVMLFCFRYDPKANKYAWYAFNVMRGAAAFALLALLIWLVPFWMRQQRS